MTRHLTILGVPVDSGGRPGGCELSPMVLRQHGLALAVNAQTDLNDLPVRIAGTRDGQSGVVGYASVLQMTRAVRDEVRGVLGRGELLLLVGGCCSFVMGAIAGARDVYKRVGLAYIDGHLDLYDGKTSPTGDCADMPFAFLMGFAPAELAQVMGTAIPVDVRDAALLGFRDAEDARSKGSLMPEALGIGLYLADDVAVISRTPSAVGELVRQRMEQGPKRFWIHLDFDVLNDKVFPAVDYLSPGGLNWPQLIDLLKPLVASDGLVGISLACYNPDLDPDHRCALEVADALRQIFNGSSHDDGGTQGT
jgi:arginase